MKKKLILILISLIVVFLFYALLDKKFKNKIQEIKNDDNAKIEQNFIIGDIVGGCSDTVRKLTEEEKKVCRDSVKDYTAIGFSQEISTYDNVKTFYPGYNLNVDEFGQILMLKKYVCSLSEEGSEQIYKSTDDFIDKLSFFNEYGKLAIKKNIERIYQGDYKNYYINLSSAQALGALDKVCPDVLNTMCYDFVGIIIGGELVDKNSCSLLCDELTKLDNDKNYISELMNKIKESASQNGIDEKYIEYDNFSFNFRLMGKESAYKACEDSSEKEMCKKFINIFELQSYPCEQIDEQIVNFLCGDKI